MGGHIVVHIGERSFLWGRKHVTFGEAEAIETAAGMSWNQWTRRLDAGYESANRVLAWSLLRREDPALKIEDVDLPLESVWRETRCDDCDEPMAIVQWADTDEVAEAKRGKTELVHVATEIPECGEPAPPVIGPTSPAGDNAPSDPPASVTSDAPTGSMPAGSSGSAPSPGSI